MDDWRPVSGPISDLGFPATGYCRLTPWDVANTRPDRVDLSDSIASGYRRVCGFATRIDEPMADNTATPPLVDAIIRINFMADGRSVKTIIAIYALVRAYSSNFLATWPHALLVGDIVAGVIGGNYIGSGRAQLDSRNPSGRDACRNLSPNTLSGDKYGDFEDWAVDLSLTSGGGTRFRKTPQSKTGFRLS